MTIKVIIYCNEHDEVRTEISTALWYHCAIIYNSNVLYCLTWLYLMVLSFVSQVKMSYACTWVMSAFLPSLKKRVFLCRTGQPVRSNSYVGSITSAAVSASSTPTCTAAPLCCTETPHTARAGPHVPPRDPQSFHLSAPGLLDWSYSHADERCVFWGVCPSLLSHYFIRLRPVLLFHNDEMLYFYI